MSASARLLAIVIGSLLSALLSAALVLAGLRAGIVPGVSPLLVLLAWLLLAPMAKGRKRDFFLLLQTSGSAGAAVTAGVIFTAPIIQIAAPDGIALAVDIYPLLYAAIAGALLGWGCVGLSARGMLEDYSLPAPEARACSQLIDAAEADEKKARPSLLKSLLLPGLLTVSSSALVLLKYLKDEVFSLPLYYFRLPLPLSPLYYGIGALLRIETAFLIALGGVGHSVVRSYSSSHGMDEGTFRWVGAAAMTIAILYTLAMYLWEQWSSARAHLERTSQPSTSVSQQVGFALAIVAGVAIGIIPVLQHSWRLQYSVFATVFVIALVMLVLALSLSAIGALLSLQVGSSASPVSGTVFVAMLALSLLFALVFRSGVIAPLSYVLVTLCVAICAANDSSQDYRTMLLQGRAPSFGYLAQLAGLLSGAAVVPATLWVAHESFYLGSSELPAPQASFFAVVLISLLESAAAPLKAIAFGAGLGVLAVLVEVWGKRRGRSLSSVSFCVGLYLPPSIGVGILLGATCRRLACGRDDRTSASGVLAAAALLSFDALVSLSFGIASVFALWRPGQAVAEQLPSFASALCAAGLLFLLYWAFRDSSGSATEREELVR